MQQFMSLKGAQEGRSRRIALNHLSPSGFQPLPNPLGILESNIRFSPLSAPQKHWVIDRPAIHQLQLAGYPSPGAGPLNASLGNDVDEAGHFLRHRSFPMATSWPLRKFSAPGVNSMTHSRVGPPSGGLPIYPASAPSWKPEERNPNKLSAATSQLTIFYAGAVNVYDDIPVDKAEAIMLLVANELNIKSNVRNAGEEELLTMKLAPSSTAAAGTQRHTAAAAAPCSALSSPLSRTSHTGDHSGSSSTATAADDPAGSTAAPPPTAAAHTIPRRFPKLERRRWPGSWRSARKGVAGTAPYPCPQRPETAQSSSRGRCRGS